METTAHFPVRDYDLAATLTSGQAFRWRPVGGAWVAVVHGRWVQLEQVAPDYIRATVNAPTADWSWLQSYLRLDANHQRMLATFPVDEPLRAAIAHCRGLRLLRQEPWECLASFILSSTKQIVQIQQCVELLCERFGDPIGQAGRAVPCPPQTTSRPQQHNSVAYDAIHPALHYTFPAAARIAAATEGELRACKMGFRARYLMAAARMVAGGELNLARLGQIPLHAARAELMRCPGVGRKIADCVLLFSCGQDAAFPIDVWVERALQRLYFPKRRARRARLEHFAATHFGPHAGLAQQYLFHYLRTGGPDHPKNHAR